MQQYEQIASVVSTALRQKELFGIVEVLKHIAEAVDAYGCVLWEVAPWADFESDPPVGQLFVLASWFADGMVLPLHEIPLQGSANGLAVRTGEIQNVTNTREDARTFKHPYIIDVAKLNAMCAVPVTYHEGQGPGGEPKITRATLTLYRNRSGDPFTDQEAQFIGQIAELIPSLYQSIRDRVGRILLGKINTILDNIQQEAEQQAKNDGDFMAPVRKGLEKVCAEVARTFQAVEATIFLEDRLEAENVFNLFATTWPNWSKEKRSYLPRKDEGLTGWVLEERKPVRIFNLATFVGDRDNLRRSYPGIEWKDSLRIRQSASEILGLPKDALPPMSFMAAPILKGERVLGAIRCCTSRMAPWFFVERQLAVLTLVAAQVSRFWGDWQKHQEEQEENQSWEILVTDISKLNHRVQDALARGALTEDDLHERILRLAKRVIRGADILDIRLHDKQKGHLYFAKPKIGSAWTRGSRQEIETRTAKRFPVNNPPAEDDPLGVKVLFEGRALAQTEAEGYRSQTFPETKRIVVAPIAVRNEIVGVLDVRGTGSRSFTAHAPRMAEILGQQLGLYLSLWQSEHQQRRGEQQQRQVFEDLWHQIKSPVRQTFARAESLVQHVTSENWHPSDEEKADILERDLRMLRGVARKAKRVADSARLLADLARESELKLSPKTMSPLHRQETVRLLIEANIDMQHALEDKRDIKFRVVERSFDPLSRHTVKVDRDLVEQAVNCLLDNAGKYSFNETVVFVFCGEATREERRFVYLAVKNQGLAIAPDEVGLCKQRNWRGKWAQLTTGEGSGIGLWVVDHIMRAHGGQLEIIPTTDEAVTEIRLLFPVA